MLDTYIDLVLKRNQMRFWRNANIAVGVIALVAKLSLSQVPWSTGVCFVCALLIHFLALPAMEGRIESERGKLKDAS